MTEHSIEELERQFEVAQSRKHQADADYREASKRLENARSAGSGLVGKKVKSRGGKVMLVDYAYVSGKGREPFSVSGYVYKKDGSLGSRHQTFYSWTVVKDGSP